MRTTPSRQRYANFRQKMGAPAVSANGDAAKDKWGGRKYLREYVRWLWPYRWAIGGVLFVALITAALDMVWPLAIKHIIDLLAGGGSPAQNLLRLDFLGGAVLALLVVKQLLETFRGYRTTVLNAKVIFRLRKRLFRRLIGLPLVELSDM